MPINTSNDKRRSWIYQWIIDPSTNFHAWLENDGRFRGTIYALLLLGFGAGLVLSILRAPHLLSHVSPAPLLIVALIGMPLTVLLNAAHFQVCSWIVGNHVSARNSIGITMASMAANLLPLPAGLLVRAGALKSVGTLYRHIGALLIASSALWISLACTIGALAIAPFNMAMSYAMIAIGSFFGVVFIALIYYSKAHIGNIFWLVVLQFSMITVDAFRIWLCCIALGVDISWTVGFVFALAPAIGSAFAFAPGGIGIREWTTAGLASAVGVLPAAGFLAAVANRLVGMASLAIIAMLYFRKLPLSNHNSGSD